MDNNEYKETSKPPWRAKILKYRDCSFWEVTHERHPGEWYDVFEDPSEADVRLASAAPEMWELLKDISSAVELHNNKDILDRLLNIEKKITMRSGEDHT